MLLLAAHMSKPNARTCKARTLNSCAPEPCAPNTSQAKAKGAHDEVSQLSGEPGGEGGGEGGESRNPGPSRADFGREVLSLRPELFSMAFRYTRNASDAEDLVQDTMMRAYGAWSRFESGTNCRAWLFRILTNSFINGYRRNKRHQRFAYESGDDTATALYGDVRQRTEGPDEKLVQEALSDEVSAALASLGDEYRQVVEMADLGEDRYKDIASKLGVPIGTVMSRLFRARRQLETMLAEYARADYGIARVAA